VIVLGAVASVGHGGAVLILPLWACVMAVLYGEHVQCCPLLSDCMCRREVTTA
jgi:hypothetical protein